MDLTDEQWAVLEPLIGELPRRADGRGRPWRGRRTGMRPHNRGVNHPMLGVRVAGQRRQQPLPDTAPHQRTNRLYTLFQAPYSAGSKRHCAPLRLIHFTASTKRRQECSSRPT
jgi:hypothetical protein